MSNYLNWQNKISTDHKIVPLLFVADYRISPVDKIVKDDEELVKLCNYTDVYKNTYINSDIEFMEGSASENEIERFLIKDGDILITKDSESWNDIGIPAIVKGDFEHTTVCGYHLALMRPYKKLVIPKYLFYCFESKQHRLQLEIEATGVTRFGIPKNAITKYKIPLPSLTQQNKIVDYLDNEVAKIDALIEKKTQLITILEEKKKAVINQVVTKGLDPNVLMKDSGIEWLDEIPEHWEVVKLKYLSKGIETGSTPNGYDIPLNDDENVYNWFTPGDFEEDYNKVYESKRKLSYEVVENTGTRLYDPNSVMFVGIGATLGKVAVTDSKFYTNQQLNIIELKDNVNKFFIAFSLSAFINVSKIIANSATLPILNQQKLGDIQIPIPKLEEQNLLVEYLEKICDNHSNVVSKILNSIELLKEKRTSIISAAVNGELNTSLS